MKKEDSHYLEFDFSGLRRYFDGSNEFWMPSGINLAELPDGDFFVDRRNYNIELGLTPPEGAHWVFGWHRLEKDGKEVLLHGRKADDDNDFYGIPTVLDVRGITDTIYGEVSKTFADKYNFRIRQEWEQYHSDRFQDWQALDSSGVVDIGDGDISDDHLGYTNWRTMFMFDSFLDDQTYVTANYMYNYLNSNSSYNDPVPVTDSHFYKTLNGAVSKRTNVGALGYRKATFLQIPGLVFGVGIRLEDSKTSGSSRLLGNSSKILTTVSKLDEVRVAEELRLVYKGIERTTLSFDADLEQRDLGWDGSYRRKGNDITIKTDFRINSKANATLMYQFVQESLNFSLGGKTSNLEIHRGMGTISCIPRENLFLVGTFMLENYDLDTAAVGTGNQAPGSKPYDFRGNSYTLLLDGTYAFNSKTSCTLGLQHTEALGTVDQAGDYVFDKVGISLKRQLAANKTIGLGYQFYNFNNHAGSGDFDDYKAHGLFATYGYTF